MMYPFLTLNDQTEIVHSEWLPEEKVRVYIEKPDVKDGFHDATCMLPGYHWQDIHGFTPEEIAKYQSILESTAHLIIQFSKEGVTVPQVFRIGSYCRRHTHCQYHQSLDH